jgi:hypothetical protein
VTLYGRPEQGRPNMVQDCLVPLIIMLRAQLPVHMIGVMTPIARWWGDTAAISAWGNAQFSNYADWLITPGNGASIGVDAVWDSRTDPALDCRNAKQVTLDTTVYQSDRGGYHKTPSGDRRRCLPRSATDIRKVRVGTKRCAGGSV